MPPVAPGQAATQHRTIRKPRHIPSRTADPSFLSLNARLASECYLAKSKACSQLRKSLWYSPTVQPDPSVPYLCLRSTPVEWLLGIFAAQNSHLKRVTRPALDQPADHDFTKPRLRRLGSVYPVRSAFTASFVWNLPLIPSICTTETV